MKLHSIFVLGLASVPVFAVARDGPKGLRRLSRGYSNGRNGRFDGHSGKEGRHSSSDFDRSDFDRPFFHGDFKPDHVSITCDAINSCDLRNGEMGTWACRSLTHPITGDTQSRAVCIRTDQAWTTDQCGCCKDETGIELECPLRPDYIPLQCADESQPDTIDLEISRMEGPGQGELELSGDRQFVCRDLINPFTGEEESVTIFAPTSRSIEGDTCGCCDGNCTLSKDGTFERPDFIEKSCAVEDPENAINCDFPSRKDDNSTDGFFVCREFFDPRGLGESRKEAVCISADRALETDQCGCCGDVCPENPRNVDIDCSVNSQGEEDHECQFRSGESGVLVCRSIFHPFDGLVRERSFCIRPDNAWITDVCGCCDEGCPSRGSDGRYDDEATQLQVLALEVPEDAHESTETVAAALGSSSASTVPSFGILVALLAFVGSLAELH